MPWYTRAKLRIETSSAGVATIGRKLYIIGGTVGATYQHVVHEWDQVANTWSRIASMPRGLALTTCTSIGSKLYVYGGVAEGGITYSELREWDQNTNIWTAKLTNPSPPNTDTPRYLAGSAAIGTKLYVTGGGTDAEDAVRTLSEWDQATNTWTTRALMPSARRGHGCAAIGTKLYVVGGVDSSAVRQNTLYEWNQITNLWSTKASLAYTPFLSGCVALDGRLHVVGSDSDMAATPPVYGRSFVATYNPSTNAWTYGAPFFQPSARNEYTLLPKGLAAALAGNVEGILCVFGGSSVVGGSGSNTETNLYQWNTGAGGGWSIGGL